MRQAGQWLLASIWLPLKGILRLVYATSACFAVGQGKADLGSNTWSANAHVSCYLLRKAGGQLLFERAHVSRVGLFLHYMERDGFADAC